MARWMDGWIKMVTKRLMIRLFVMDSHVKTDEAGLFTTLSRKTLNISNALRTFSSDEVML